MVNMAIASAFVQVLPLAGLAAAFPAVSSPFKFRRQTGRSEACAEIAEVYEESRALRIAADVKPSLAYECLRSVPVDVDRDVALLQYMRPWFEFQSTVGILPDPPKEYLYPGVDIFAGLDNITQSLENGGYESQVDFTTDLYRLINVKPRDGHLGYSPALSTLIRFDTPELFISISEDGVKSPKIYLYSDYLQSKEQGYTPSEVATFDTAKITDHLQQRSVDNSRDQDPDAAWNEQLFSAAMENIGEVAGATRYMHTTLADQSVIEFTNGTKMTVDNVARVIGDFSGIRSGDDVHRRFEVPGSDGQAESPANSSRRTFTPALEAYPEPFIIHRDRYVSGYHLPGPDFEDTAVLVLNSFTTQNDTRAVGSLVDALEFVRVNTGFVERSRRERKTKLIIDLQGNGGGLVANAMSLYGILFPEGGKTAHMNMRVRANPTINWVGSTAEKRDPPVRNVPYPFGYEGFLNEDLRNFTSWEDFYGPDKLDGVDYTNVLQPETVSWAAQGAPGILRIPRPWFRPEDTVIITDGHCASACAYVVGMLTRDLGIQAIALGGRPIEAPMQTVGGTKGGIVIALEPYQELYSFFRRLGTPPSGVDLTPFAREPPLAGPPPDSWVVNSANIYLDDDLDGVPAQFRYEAANCKLYYTWETLTNMTRLWAAVSDVKWNAAKCVPGSTTNSDGTIGDKAPGYSDKVVSSFKWQAGPGDVVPGSAGSGGGGSSGGDGGGGGDGNKDEDENAAGSVRASWGVMSVVAAATVVVLFFM